MWREGASECLSAAVHRYFSLQTRVSVNKVVLKMLLSTVVNLLSTIHGTQSASQAASPLILSWSDLALMIPVGGKLETGIVLSGCISRT